MAKTLWLTAVYCKHYAMQQINDILPQLKTDFPHVKFVRGTDFVWSPKNKQITYVVSKSTNEIALWALLHEVAHADLGHEHYEDDFALLQKEVAAWERAKVLAQGYDIVIGSNHIEDCLDTYRDWLHARAKCPACGVVSLQRRDGLYQCFNCKTTWKVPRSQLCRVSRRIVTA